MKRSNQAGPLKRNLNQELSTVEFVTHPKKIVCVLLQGNASEIIARLHEEKGVDSCDIHRGRGRSTALKKNQTYGEYVEVEVISVEIEAERADEIFEFLYYEAGLDHTNGGFLYQVPVVQSTVFKLPDIPEEETP